jgi:hypothetical protein
LELAKWIAEKTEYIWAESTSFRGNLPPNHRERNCLAIALLCAGGLGDSFLQTGVSLNQLMFRSLSA